MFFNSYSNINFKNKGKYRKIINNHFYYKTGSLNNSLFSKILQNNILTAKPKQNNYVNYTFSEKKFKFLHNTKTTNIHKKVLNTKRNQRPKLTIVNDYFQSLQKATNNWRNSLKFSKESNINYKSSRNFGQNNIIKEINLYNNNNNYNNEVLTNRDNISKFSHNNSTKSFLNENFGAYQSKNDFLNIHKERYIKLIDELKIINNFSKKKINSVFNKPIPICKKLKILKEAKNSIDKITKSRINSSSSFKALFEESNISNNNEIKSYHYKDYNGNISNISSKKPVIIKYNPKPKLTVPKFVNINNIQVL